MHTSTFFEFVLTFLLIIFLQSAHLFDLYVSIYIYLYLYLSACIHIYIYIYTHTYIHTCVCMLFFVMYFGWNNNKKQFDKGVPDYKIQLPFIHWEDFNWFWLGFKSKTVIASTEKWYSWSESQNNHNNQGYAYPECLTCAKPGMSGSDSRAGESQ